MPSQKENQTFKKGHIPWNKGLHNHLSKESLEKIRKSVIGRLHTEEWKEKARIRMMGNKHTLGFHPSIESIKKMLISRKGYRHSEKTKIKISLGNKGKIRSEELKNKLSAINLGKYKGLTYEQRYGKEKADKLKLYLSEKNIGKIVSNNTKEKLRLLNTGKKLSRETIQKIRLKNSREKSYNWLGGKSFEPYSVEFNKEFKNLVRLRDNFCCINCGTSEQKHKLLLNQRLHVHHIDYNKKNTCLRNCCALCHRCNVLANQNRHEWKDYYQTKLKDKYSYNYDEQTIELKLPQ